MVTPYGSSAPLRDKIAKLSKEGKSVRQMAEILRLDKSTIRNMGLAKRQTITSPLIIDQSRIQKVNRWLTRRWL